MFNILNDILFSKKGNQLQNINDENDFQPYMINRWLSMYNSINTKLINISVNQFYSIFDTKQEWYKFYLILIPQSRYQRIPYIKKAKTDNEDKEIIQFLAEQYQLSQREIKQYIEEFNIDLTEIKKSFTNKPLKNK